METKIGEVQTVAADSWARYDPGTQNSPSIQPVAKSEKSSSAKVDTRQGSDAGSTSSSVDVGRSKELAQAVQKYLQDVNVQLNFEVHQETGDVIIKVVNGDTGDTIRQIPPDDLVKLHDKLQELRGVLFHGKV